MQRVKNINVIIYLFFSGLQEMDSIHLNTISILLDLLYISLLVLDLIYNKLSIYYIFVLLLFFLFPIIHTMLTFFLVFFHSDLFIKCRQIMVEPNFARIRSPRPFRISILISCNFDVLTFTNISFS